MLVLPPGVGPPSYGESFSCPCSWLPCHLLNYVFSPSATPHPHPCRQTPLPRQADTPGRRLLLWTVRILLQCILFFLFLQKMEQKCRLNLLRLLLFLTLACLTFFIVVAVVVLKPYLEAKNYVNTSCIMVRNVQ